MEAAPLSLAYSHARNAAVENFHKSNPTAASEEHDLAAGEFANAARSTVDIEALRTLRLLEQHHQKLAELLKYKPPGISPAFADSPDSVEEARLTAQDAPRETEKVSQQSRRTPENSPRHVSNQPIPSLKRDMSSSIASNLASARGIRPNRQRPDARPTAAMLSPQTADGRMAARSSRSDRIDEHDADVPVRHRDPDRPHPQTNAALGRIPPPLPLMPKIPPSVLSTNDDAFARFYSTFESLGTKLSAALAFTGLPLPSSDTASDTTVQTIDATPSEKDTYAPTSPTFRRDRSTVNASSPDVSRLISRAALRAMKDDMGTNVSESFYVVPTTGGTLSYANMLNHARDGSALSNEGIDEFVDAREVQMPGTPQKGRSRGPTAAGGEGLGMDSGTDVRAAGRQSGSGVWAGRGGGKWRKTQEEVAYEAEHWKTQAMDLADRLKAFEMNALSQSVMHASIYREKRGGKTSMQPLSMMKAAGSAGTVESGSGTSSDGVMEMKVKELEAELEKVREEARRVVKENKKLEAVVDKYRKRFDELKEQARGRIRREEEMRGKGEEAVVAT